MRVGIEQELGKVVGRQLVVVAEIGLAMIVVEIELVEVEEAM